MPFFVNWPGVVAAGQRTAEPVIGVDLYPTFLDLARAERPDQPLDGVSLLPLLKGEVPALAARPLFWHFPPTSSPTRPRSTSNPTRSFARVPAASSG